MTFKYLLLAGLLISLSNVAYSTTYVVFRYDDFAADKPGVRERDIERMRVWEAEKAVDSLFEKHGVPYVIAIIPKLNGTWLAEDIEKAEFLKQGVAAGRIEVAQHGLSHTNHAKPRHRYAEFRERPYEAQLMDILEGKRILCKGCGISKIATFVPPWNAWDSHTARALKKAGFRILSAMRYHYCDSVKGLTVIPRTGGLFQLELIMEKTELAQDSIVVVLYHPYDLVQFAGKESCFGIERSGRVLEKLSRFPNVEVLTLSQLADRRDDLTAERFREAVVLFKLRDFWSNNESINLLPEHLLPGADMEGFYLSAAEYSKSLWYWRTITTAFAAGLFIIGLCVRRLLRSILSAKWGFRLDVIASLVFFLSVLKEIQIVNKGYHMTAISAVPAFVAGSFLIGLILRVAEKASAARLVRIFRR